MKTLQEILKQEPVYLHNWAEDKKFGLIADFEDVYITKKDYDSMVSPYPNEDSWLIKKIRMQEVSSKYDIVNILFASYGEDNYSGDAFVLFEQDGKLFEVNAGHCSCHGLEGQFNPEETSLESLKYRLIEGKMGVDDYSDNEFAKELKHFLGIV